MILHQAQISELHLWFSWYSGDGYSYLYRHVAFPPLIFFSSWCLVLGWRAKATFEHKSGFFILCGGKPGAFAELKTEIKPLKVDCMCPATHILFWLLTFLRLKIYLESLVSLFFGEFISYSFKNNKTKNKQTKTNKNSTVFFLKGNKQNKVFVDHSFRGWLQNKTGPLLFQKFFAEP